MSIRHRVSGLRVRWIIGLGLAAAFCVQCHTLISELNTQPSAGPGFGASPAVAKIEQPTVDVTEMVQNSLEVIAREKPLELLHKAQERYRDTITDYTCTFRKQENLNGKLTKVQGAKVKFRVKDNSVFMHWTENPDKARRVIYVEDKWNTKDGKAGALCEPEGAVARLVVKSIVMPIHGAQAKAASRRSIDQFGFAKALELIVKYSQMAKENGELDLRFAGEGEIGGRPTFVYERILPYTGEDGTYPDCLLVYHLDQDTLLPLQCASYADRDKTQLLGKYQYTDVELNPGLSEADFNAETYGL